MSWKDRAKPIDTSIASNKPSWRDRAVPVEMVASTSNEVLPAVSEEMTEEVDAPLSTTTTEDFLRGASQGATLGFQDELSALAEKGIANTAEFLGLQDEAVSDVYNDKSYSDLRDTFRAQDAESQKNSPVVHTLGNVVGSLPASIATGGGAAGLAGNAGKLAKAGVNIATAAGMGGLQGAGQSTAEDLGGVAKDTAIGGLIGAGTAGAFEAAASGGKKLISMLADKWSGKLGNAAERAAVKSLSPSASQYQKLAANGQVEELGRKLLDEDVVTAFASPASKASKLAALKSQTGKAINESADALDDKIAQAVSGSDAEKAQAIKDLLSRRKFISNVESKTLAPLENIGDPNNLGFRTKELLSKAEGLTSKADEAIVTKNASEAVNDLGVNSDILSFGKTNRFKQAAREGINYNTDGGASAQNIKSFTKELNDEMLSKADEAAGLVDGAANVDALKQANKNYGMIKTASKAADSLAGKAEMGKDPATVALAGIGALTQGPAGLATGFALGQAKKAVQTYGRSIQASGLDKLANIVKTTPDVLGKFAAPLANAATRGQASLAATNFVLSQQSPEYRDLTNNMNSSQEEAEKLDNE